MFFPISEANLQSSQPSVHPAPPVPSIDSTPMSSAIPSLLLLGLMFVVIWRKTTHAQQQSLEQQRALLERIWEMSPRK
jgi:hypothetical protein